MVRKRHRPRSSRIYGQVFQATSRRPPGSEERPRLGRSVEMAQPGAVPSPPAAPGRPDCDLPGQARSHCTSEDRQAARAAGPSGLMDKALAS